MAEIVIYPFTKEMVAPVVIPSPTAAAAKLRMAAKQRLTFRKVVVFFMGCTPYLSAHNYLAGDTILPFPRHTPGIALTQPIVKNGEINVFTVSDSL